MAGVKISALPALSSPALTDIYPTVQSGVTYKVTLAQIAEQFSSHSALRLATTAALTATYSNGSSGVGATLTNAGALAALSIDGVAVALNDLILVKNQASSFQNGVYTVTVVGDGATAWVLTRATFFDEASDVDAGDSFTVAFGTVNAKTQWIETAVVATMGTDAITFESNVVAGAGITKTNNSLAVSGGGMAWTEVTGASQSMAIDNGYIASNAGLVTLTLPVTSSVGSRINLAGKGAGGWSIAQNAGQQIQIGSAASTVGAGGSVASTNRWDSVQLVCVTANTLWVALGGPQSAGLTVT